MTGETTDRPSGEHAGPGSPPGWYADPVRKSSLRRWDGAHWTADVEPVADTPAGGPSGVGGDSGMRRGWMWVAALAVPAMVTWSWIALWERDHCGVGDTDFAWAIILVLPLGLFVGGVNLCAALIAALSQGKAAVMRIVITVSSCGLALLDYIVLGVRGYWEVNGEGFSRRSETVMLACLAVSLVPVVMMWLSARPAHGAERRWWESAAVQVIARGTLIAGVGLTAAYWRWATETCTF
jgi:hypothetical protein